MNWWHIYAEVWLAAAVLCAALTYACRAFAPSLGFMDRPMREEHKQHGRATPVLGGLGMFLSWAGIICGGIAASAACRGLIGPEIALYLPGIQTVAPQLLCILLGAAGLVALGLADDRWSLDPLSKLVGQFVVAGAVACWGVRITVFWSQPVITWALTTFWILFIINAVNFYDNMDGLAAGMAAIAALFFAFVAGVRGQYFVAVLASATCGSACGFLVFNHPPATIFMGDSGSHFLGYVLAVIGALTTFYTPSESVTAGPASPTLAPLFIPLLVLALPIFDLCAVVVIRLRQRRPIYVGDHAHISHRFEKMGLSRTQAVVVVHLLGFAIGASALTLLWLPARGVAIVLLQTAALLALVSILHAVTAEGRP